MRHLVVAALIATAGLVSVGPANAQNPSADQIIRGLRPTAPSSTTRGIRPLAPTEAPAPAAPMAGQPATAAQAPRVGQPVAQPRQAGPVPSQPGPAPAVNLTVNFASGSAEVTPAASRTLDELGRALTSAALSAYRFRIEGHTDTVGSPEANKALSERRAAAVVGYLMAKWNVDRTRIESLGMGQDQPVVPTGPGVAQPRNRRVTVINLGA